ncbi:hydrophobic surface binding protein [Auricularia subglabra TFB-10046 SS5]|nr:hydrophobic surface binding protein [Auricularia subglabra TFB-10046 SS5]
MRFSRAVVTVLAVAAPALAAVIGARSAAEIVADIDVLTTRVTKLDNDVTAFPNTGGSLVAALGIHTDSVNVDNALKQATTSTLATGPLTEEEGSTILGQFQVLEPIIIHALDGVVEKKAAFAALPIGGIPALVKQDISTLSTDTKAFENAILAIAPASHLADAQAIIDSIDAGFARAIAAYA